MPRLSRTKERRVAAEREAALEQRCAELEDACASYERERRESVDTGALLTRTLQHVAALEGRVERYASELTRVNSELADRESVLRVTQEDARRAWKAEQAAVADLARLRITLQRVQCELNDAKRQAPADAGPGVLRFATRSAWLELVQLVHPDVHNEGRREAATRVTQMLNAARPTAR